MKEQDKKVVLHQDSNPNKEYSLLYICAGDDIISELGEELVTDGDISDMVHRYNETSDVYRRGSAVIKIKNASYTIVQRIADKNVANADVFTTIQEEAKLNRVVDIALERQGDNGEFLITKCPYVRKIKL